MKAASALCNLRVLLMLVAWVSLPCMAEEQSDTTAAEHLRTVVARNVPIALSMRVGQEKVLSFDEDVQWSVPNELIGIATGEAVAGNVYLSSQETFEKARFRFRGIDSNRYYIIDITASDRGEPGPIRVKAADAAQPADTTGNPVDSSSQRPSGIPQLTRYAFQAVYAQERLIERPWDVSEARINRDASLERLFVGATVIARPLAQWRSQSGDYAIALALENQEMQEIELDPRRMRRNARWVSMAMIQDRLAPRGLRGDTTTIVIVADGRWSEVSTWLR